MKRRKLVASALVLAMTGSVFAGCSSKTKEESSNGATVLTEIKEDTPWFNINEIGVDEEYKTSAYDYSYSNIAASTEDGVVISINATKKMPENMDYDNYNPADYEENHIKYVTYDGEVKYDVEIPYMEDTDDFYIGSSDCVNGVILITGTAYDKQYNGTTYNLTVDVETGEVSGWVPSHKFGDDSTIAPVPEGVADCYCEKTINANGYTVYVYSCYTPDWEQYYVMLVTDANGNTTQLDMRDALANTEVWGFDGGVPVDDSKLLFVVGSSGANDEYVTMFCELNLSDMSFTEVKDEYDWLKNYGLYNVKTFDGYGTFSVDNEGIKKFDFENKKVENYLTSDNCNLNVSKLSGLEIVELTDTKLVLAGNVWVSSMTSSDDVFKIITLTKADKNPNAGKTVIKMASLTGYDYAMYESICNFNESSDTAFMVIDRRYDVNTADYSDVNTYDDYMKIYRETATSMGDKLTVDIMAGEGPDILFNANMLTQLNNSNYLVDLSDCAEGDSLFANIIDTCKTDGALYQVPVVISTVGITTYKDYVEDGQVGFTFEQYKTFVDTVCNGKDPIDLTRSEYFSALYAAMASDFRNGNTIDFNNEAFKALAEYCKNDVIESNNDNYDDGVWIEDIYEENPNAQYGNISNISSFFNNYGDRVEDVRVLGLPSFDGRGPQFQIATAVAVSAQTKNLDACKDYVKSLLDSDNQMMFASSSWASPVNKDVMYEVGKLAVEEHNHDVEEDLKWFTEEEMIMYNIPSTILDDTAIDYYVSIVEGCTSCATTDVAIQTIMFEEMQPYYEGQKDIDTVIDTMSNRITTYLKERG